MIKKIFERLYFKYAMRTNLIAYYRKQGMKIGEGCEIFSDVTFGSEPYLISLGDNVRLTSGVKFVTHDGGLWTLRKMGKLIDADKFGSISIGNNVHIGWGTILMPGINIGNNCVVGCGSVVTKSIPDNSVAAGVPARVIKSIEDYYEGVKDVCVFTKKYSADQKKQYLIDKSQ